MTLGVSCCFQIRQRTNLSVISILARGLLRIDKSAAVKSWRVKEGNREIEKRVNERKEERV